MAKASRLPSAHADGAKPSARAPSFDVSDYTREAQDMRGEANAARVRVIIERCARRHGFTSAELIGKGRSQPLVDARNEAIALVAHVFPKFSTPHLGRIFGGRDHTTILHALGRTAASQRSRAKQ